MTESTKLVPPAQTTCSDCLNDCGDDPAVQSGTAAPCSTYGASQATKIDNDGVTSFALAMALRLTQARGQGRGGWHDPSQCSIETLGKLFAAAAFRGKTIDAGNYLMMLHQRGAEREVITQALVDHCHSATLPPPTDPGWPSAPGQCWGTNDEDFGCDTLDELLEQNGDLQPGDVVYVGEAHHPDPAEYADAEYVLDQVASQGYDDGGEYAENYPDVSTEAQAQLNSFLRPWLRKHCAPSFYVVSNSRPHTLTEADFAGRGRGEVPHD